MTLLIKNGRVMNPATKTDEILDILIENETIVKMEKNLFDADEVIDATGCLVVPGFIDLHVHLREPGLEYKETIATGTRAAARGGFTSICPMPNTKPVIDSPEMVSWIVEKAKTDSVVHVLPVGAVTKGMAGAEVTDISGMKAAGAIAISEDGKSVMDSGVYREAMRQAAKEDVIVLAHCEDINLVQKGVMNAGKEAERLGLRGIGNAVEDIIVARDILLAKETGARLHLCHCSTKDSVTLTALGKKEGVKVSAEVCPHHFAMTCEDIKTDDANYKMNPPLRGRADVEALKQGLKDGTMDCISTDHAPHSAEEKAKSMAEAPFGIVGLETAYALSHTHLVTTGLMDDMELAAKMSYLPAKILGIDKGDLSIGKMADIAIVDPNAEEVIDVNTFASKGKNTPFGGHKVTGKVMATVVAGKVVYQA